MQVRNLRERLEEEHQALLQREQDKASLEMRIARLTRIILSSTRLTRADSALGWRYRQMLRSDPQVRHSKKSLSHSLVHLYLSSMHSSVASVKLSQS